MNDAGINTWSVVVADDHKMFAEAICAMLEKDGRLEILSVVEDGTSLIDTVRSHQPDIALVDVTMPGPGAEAIAKAVAGSQTRLVALTMHLDRGLADHLILCGYAAYVVKDAAVAELVEAMQAVLRGEIYLSKAVLTIDTVEAGKTILTKRETACLALAAEGFSNQRIGKNLTITERTVKFHLENILRKLNASSRGEAVAIARRIGLL